MVADLDLALRIRADVRQAAQRLKSLERNVDQLGNAASPRGAAKANQLASAWERTRRRMATVSRVALNLRTAIAGAVAVGVITSIARTGLEFERLQRRMNFAAGSARDGARDMAFVREEVERLGIDLFAAGQGFSALAASARGTALEGQAARDIFTAIAEASTVLGLSADQTQGALTAVEQIISKGKVSAEELRGQLGERLPGAFQIAARAMGITTAELDEMLVKGELLAEDFLPLFARELRATFAADVPEAAQSSEAAFNRLGNSIRDLQNAIAEAGLLDWLADSAAGVTSLIRALTGGIEGQVAAATSAERRLADATERRNAIERDPTGRGVGGSSLLEAQRALNEAQRLVEQQSLDDSLNRFEGVEGRLAPLLERLAALQDELDETATGTRADLTDRARATLQSQIAALQAEIEPLQAERARLVEDINILAARQEAARPDTQEPPPPAGEPDDDVRARERANEQVLALEQQLQDRLARIHNTAAENLERDRVELHRRLTELEEAGADPEAVAAARLSIDQLYFRRYGRLQAEEIARANEKRLEAHRDVIAEIEDQEASLDIGSAYDRAIRDAQRWRDEALAALDETAEGYEELQARVEAVYAAMEEAAMAAAREQERAARGFVGGAEQGLEDYAREATDAFAQAERATVNAFKGMEDALVNFVQTGKLDFSSLVDSIIADLARIAIQQTITGPLAAALLGSLGGGGASFGGGADGALFHSGGRVGASARRVRSNLPLALWAGAPRFHQGGIAQLLRPGEIPAILRDRETVRTPEQELGLQRALAGPSQLRVELVNGSGQALEARDASATFDPEQWVIRVWLDDAASGGPTSRMIEGIVRNGGA